MTNQEKWFALKDNLGEQEARKLLAQQLRLSADQVEKGGYPDVFGCQVKEKNPDDLYEPFIWTVSVTLSYPWPG